MQPVNMNGNQSVPNQNYFPGPPMAQQMQFSQQPQSQVINQAGPHQQIMSNPSSSYATQSSVSQSNDLSSLQLQHLRPQQISEQNNQQQPQFNLQNQTLQNQQHQTLQNQQHQTLQNQQNQTLQNQQIFQHQDFSVIQCQFCPKQFQSQHLLQQHQISADCVQNCRICGNQVPTQSYQQHLIQHQQDLINQEMMRMSQLQNNGMYMNHPNQQQPFNQQYSSQPPMPLNQNAPNNFVFSQSGISQNFDPTIQSSQGQSMYFQAPMNQNHLNMQNIQNQNNQSKVKQSNARNKNNQKNNNQNIKKRKTKPCPNLDKPQGCKFIDDPEKCDFLHPEEAQHLPSDQKTQDDVQSQEELKSQIDEDFLPDFIQLSARVSLNQSSYSHDSARTFNKSFQPYDQVEECHDFYFGCCKKQNCTYDHNGPGKIGFCLKESCATCDSLISFNQQTKNLVKRCALISINDEHLRLFQELTSLKNEIRNLMLENPDRNYIKQHPTLLRAKTQFQKFQSLRDYLHKLSEMFSQSEKKAEKFAKIEWEKYMQGLPVYIKRNELLKLTTSNEKSPFRLIVGHTGSGKSTQIPQYLLIHNMMFQKDSKIYCVLPRNIAAKTLADRVSKEMKGFDKQIGFEIGNHRSDTIINRTARLIFTSEQTFLQKLLKNKYQIENMHNNELFNVSHIFLDEVHERSFCSDIIMGTLRNMFDKKQLQQQLKVLLCSATLNKDIFTQFFYDCSMLEIEGKTHEIIDEYRPTKDEEDILSSIKEVLTDVLESRRNGGPLYMHGHILIFVDGVQSIETTTKIVEELLQKTEGFDPKEFIILQLHGLLEPEDQENIFKEFIIEDETQIIQEEQKQSNSSTRLGQYRTKIIISNKLAESSVTIDGVTVVIDTGLTREAMYNPEKRLTSINTEPISQAQAIQRRGRAGRTSKGICYRLYSKETFESSLPDKQPEIRRTNSEIVLLKIIGLGIQKVEDFPLIDQIDKVTISSGIKTLIQLGALSIEGDLTQKGRLMTEFSTDPQKTNVILQALKRNCLDQCLLAIAMVQNCNQIYKFNKDVSTEEQRSDLVIYTRILGQFVLLSDQKLIKEFCEQHQLSRRTLNICKKEYKELELEIRNLKEKITKDMSAQNFFKKKFFKKDEEMDEEELDLKLIKCFFSSYFNNFSTSNTHEFSFRCQDTTFRSNKNSCIRKEHNKRRRMQFPTFWLKMNSFQNGVINIAYCFSILNDSILNDETIVDKLILKSVKEAHQDGSADHYPQTFICTSKDFKLFMNEYKAQIFELQKQLPFQYQHNQEELTLVVRKYLYDGSPNSVEVIKNSFEDFFKDFKILKKQFWIEVPMADSDARFVFDGQFKLKAVLGPQDYVQIKLKIHPDYLEQLYEDIGFIERFELARRQEEKIKQMLEQDTIARSSRSIDRLGYLHIDLFFRSPTSARRATIELQNHDQIEIIKSRDDQERQKLLKSNIQITLKWVINESSKSACIECTNSDDAKTVIKQLNGKVLENEITLLEEKNLYKDERSCVYLTELHYLTDEQDLKELIIARELFDYPKVVVNREENKGNQYKNSQRIVQGLSKVYEQFIKINNYREYLPNTKYTNQGCFAMADFQVETDQEAQEIYNRFEGKTLLGEQKIRVRISYQTTLQVLESMYVVLKQKFEKLSKKLIQQYAKHGLKIYATEEKKKYKQKIDYKIIVNCKDQHVQKRANIKIGELFNKGKRIFQLDLIKNSHKKIEYHDLLKDKYVDKVYIKYSSNRSSNHQLFSQSQEIEEQFLADFTQIHDSILQEIFKERQMSGKSNKCQICLIDKKSLVKFSGCGHEFCDECFQEYIFTKNENKLTHGMKCPMQTQDCDFVTTKMIQDILESKFDEICQMACKEAVYQTQLVQKCWTPDCPSVFYISKDKKEHKCDHCKTTWCIGFRDENGLLVKHEPHGKTPCADHIAQLNAMKSIETGILPKGEVITLQWLLDQKSKGEIIQRRCPRDSCRKLFELKELNECKEVQMEITCSECGQEFCFQCGEGFANRQAVHDHVQAVHGENQ